MALVVARIIHWGIGWNFRNRNSFFWCEGRLRGRNTPIKRGATEMQVMFFDLEQYLILVTYRQYKNFLMN